jgi:hypothetical protein
MKDTKQARSDWEYGRNHGLRQEPSKALAFDVDVGDVLDEAIKKA